MEFITHADHFYYFLSEMNEKIKNLLKKIIPRKVAIFLYSIKPMVTIVNFYILKGDKLIENLSPIDEKYKIRQLNINDSEQLKEFYANPRHIIPRLKHPSWVGLATIDSTNNAIAYVSWVITKNIPFINEFDLFLKENQFMVIHGYCDPKYRHQGIHTRMEEERINWCIRNGAKEIYVHIGSNNKKGIPTLIKAGYKYLMSAKTLRIPALGIYREYQSALKRPFRKQF